MYKQFRNRVDAGNRLAQALYPRFNHLPDTVTVGIAKGGTPVAFQVAFQLGLPLDIIYIKKLFSGRDVIGAVSDDGEISREELVIQKLKISSEEFDSLVRKEIQETKTKMETFRGARPPLREVVNGKKVILVDDGVGTGVTAEAAIRSLYKRGASEVVLAIPVVSADQISKFAQLTARIDAIYTPLIFKDPHQFYVDLPPVLDDEVSQIIKWKTVETPKLSRHGGRNLPLIVPQ